MSEFRKTFDSEVYFVTLTVVEWVDIFSRKEYKDIIVENLKYCQEKEGLQIYSYVIMTNHLHMIVRYGKNLKELLGRFKGYTSKRILSVIEKSHEESRKDWLLYLFNFFAKKNKQYSNYHLWQYTNHPTPLYSSKLIQQKFDYIHLNPVRAGIVTEPDKYIYSSACAESPLKVIEI